MGVCAGVVCLWCGSVQVWCGWLCGFGVELCGEVGRRWEDVMVGTGEWEGVAGTCNVLFVRSCTVWYAASARGAYVQWGCEE